MIRVPRRVSSLVLSLLLAAGVLLSTHAALAADPPRSMRRLAIVVGANDPAPGRQPLRYAHADAQLMADVLERVGRFAKNDIQVLIEPRPADVLVALERAGLEMQRESGDSLLVFYYSGHSDGQRLFPRGEALPVAALRDRVARSSARVRVAILDTCRGGTWTRTKGLTVGPPLDGADLMNLATEGTALLSSSSGVENAHEAAAVKGSFFTHHVAAGLLGAADKSGDGNVTLQEVFEYAKERTIRDSARMAVTTQHPSFDLQLRGRQDVVLAQVASSPSALELAQANALEVIHLESGVTVAETPAGRQRLRLALAPGRYLVRRVVDGRVYSKEVSVQPGSVVSLEEGQLELTGSERLAMKSGAEELPYSAHSTLPKGRSEIRLGLGTSIGPRTFGGGMYLPSQDDKSPSRGGELERSLAGVAAFSRALTDRLTWAVPVPAFAYRLGDEGAFEAIPHAGLASLGYSAIEGLIGTLDAGVATRVWLAPEISLISNASASWDWRTRDVAMRHSDVLALRVSAGIAWNVTGRVTLALGLGLSGGAVLREERTLPGADAALGPSIWHPSTSAVFGSVQTLGYRPLPLVQVYLTRGLSLDAYASFGVDLRSGTFRDRYLAGFTAAF